MTALAVVEDLEVLEDRVGQLDPGAPGLLVEELDVEPSQHPIYLKADGVTEVYVRNGTTSPALPVHEIAGYIRSHWP